MIKIGRFGHCRISSLAPRSDAYASVRTESRPAGRVGHKPVIPPPGDDEEAPHPWGRVGGLSHAKAVSGMGYSGAMSNAWDAPNWRKSSRSKTGSGDNDWCVEVAALAPDVRGFRDSKLHESPVVKMSTAEFGRFVSAVKAL